MTVHVPGVRRRSVRVALAATAVVAVAYVVVAAGVVLFATRDLTDQVDQRLVGTFQRLQGEPPGPGGGPPDPGRDPGRPFGAPLLLWRVESDGSVEYGSTTPALPAEYHEVTSPMTAIIDGVPFRVAGIDLGDDRLVVAQSMEQVADAQRTILLGELLIAPFLLAAVFVGSVIVGRRVAEPIEAAHRRQVEFTADASHELRTPLSVIEAHTTLALAHDRDATWYRDAFRRVDRESKRMRHLLEDMLWLARFDAEQAPRSSEPVDLGVLAAQSADRFAPVAETRHLALAVHPPAAPVVIAASPELLDRLVGVLIDNACKYSPEGGRVDVTVAGDGHRGSVTVDDTGPGIPEAERARIFNRFHRAGGTAAEASGAGLGLAIGDAIVRATNGRWAVGTSPTGGARFAVSWPRTSLS